ncbi:MAG: hypothetical protein R6W94_09055 [Spirochaetia bacterium]
MLLFELFAEYDDQVNPEGNRQPASCFDKCFFAQLGGIVAFGIMLALGRLLLAVFLFSSLPLSLLVAQVGGVKLLLVFQQLQGFG